MLMMMLMMAFPVLGLIVFYLFPFWVALPLYVSGMLLSALSHWLMTSSKKLKVTTGVNGIVGRPAKVLSWQERAGYVRCHGELWPARTESDEGPAEGENVDVIGVDGLTLIVRPHAPSRSPTSSSSGEPATGVRASTRAP